MRWWSLDLLAKTSVCWSDHPDQWLTCCNCSMTGSRWSEASADLIVGLIVHRSTVALKAPSGNLIPSSSRPSCKQSSQYYTGCRCLLYFQSLSYNRCWDKAVAVEDCRSCKSCTAWLIWLRWSMRSALLAWLAYLAEYLISIDFYVISWPLPVRVTR